MVAARAGISRAGISRATVSRGVNGATTVDPTIRARVLRAVSDLGCVPNQAARSLVTHRSDSIGLVLAEARQPGLLRRPVLRRAGHVDGLIIASGHVPDPLPGHPAADRSAGGLQRAVLRR